MVRVCSRIPESILHMLIIFVSRNLIDIPVGDFLSYGRAHLLTPALCLFDRRYWHDSKW